LPVLDQFNDILINYWIYRIGDTSHEDALKAAEKMVLRLPRSDEEAINAAMTPHNIEEEQGTFTDGRCTARHQQMKLSALLQRNDAHLTCGMFASTLLFLSSTLLTLLNLFPLPKGQKLMPSQQGAQ
jgi:hypothetical protein